MQEKPCGGATGLPLRPVKVHATRGALYSLFDVGIGKYDHGVITAELQADVLDHYLGGCTLNQPPCLDTAGQRNALDAGVAHQRVARGPTVP